MNIVLQIVLHLTKLVNFLYPCLAQSLVTGLPQKGHGLQQSSFLQRRQTGSKLLADWSRAFPERGSGHICQGRSSLVGGPAGRG